MPATRLLCATALAAALLVPASAQASVKFRILTMDYDVTHTADWQTEDAAGRQSLTLSTGDPVRQSINYWTDSDVPFSFMSNDSLAFEQPRGTVRRSVDGAAPCAVKRPKVRSWFQVEGRGAMGTAPFDVELNIGTVPGLATACGGAAEPQLATPPEIVFARSARGLRRLRLGARRTLTTRMERGLDADGLETDACLPRPPAGQPWACSVTEATVRVKRVD